MGSNKRPNNSIFRIEKAMLGGVYVFLSFDGNSNYGNDDREQPAKCYQIRVYLPITHHSYNKRIILNRTVNNKYNYRCKSIVIDLDYFED